MPSSSADSELFPLSWLSQYGYCPRRCGLLSIDQMWMENAETAAGRSQHERVHTARTERRGDTLFLYELGVFSRSLGTNGKCDCVEAHEDPSGVPLPYGPGRYRLYPVEYKHGIVRQEEEYQLQLCAQAICLEEQFSCTIPKGALFYIDAHRRDEVELTPQLREKTVQTAAHIRTLLETQQIPTAVYSAKCKRCSMQELCRPKLRHSASAYCRALWQLMEGDGEN